MASVPTTASTLAKTNARVTNFRKHSAHMVLACTQPRRLEAAKPPPSRSASLQKTQNLLPSQLRRDCAKRTALIEVLKLARKGNGGFLKYVSKLGCHLNEGVQQMLSANPSLYFTLTPRSGAWPPQSITTHSREPRLYLGMRSCCIQLQVAKASSSGRAK